MIPPHWRIPPQEAQMIKLEITYDATTGQVNANGPINNKGLCYMMLECAKDAVRDFVEKQSQEPAIVPARNGDILKIRPGIEPK